MIFFKLLKKPKTKRALKIIVKIFEKQSQMFDLEN